MIGRNQIVFYPIGWINIVPATILYSMYSVYTLLLLSNMLMIWFMGQKWIIHTHIAEYVKFSIWVSKNKNYAAILCFWSNQDDDKILSPLGSPSTSWPHYLFLKQFLGFSITFQLNFKTNKENTYFSTTRNVWAKGQELLKEMIKTRLIDAKTCTKTAHIWTCETQ